MTHKDDKFRLSECRECAAIRAQLAEAKRLLALIEPRLPQTSKVHGDILKMIGDGK